MPESKPRLGATLGGFALTLGLLALATLGPFAQGTLVATVVGVPLAGLGFAFGARRTAWLALLALASALAINPLFGAVRHVEYAAVLVGIVLATVGAVLLGGYLKTRRLAGDRAR